MRAPLLVAFVSLALPAPGDGPAELQGRWELVSVELDGKDSSLTENRPRCEIVGDRVPLKDPARPRHAYRNRPGLSWGGATLPRVMTVRYGGEDLAVLSADPDAMPKSIDLRFGRTGRTLEGVYVRDGETLKVCLNRRSEGAKERPHLLSTRGHDSWRLLVFRRAAGGDYRDPGFVGLALGVDEARKEVVVEDLLEDTPAAKSGLKKGDVLVAIGGVEVTGLRAAIEEVRRAKPGEMLPLRIRRDGGPKEIKVRVGVMPFTLIADLE